MIKEVITMDTVKNKKILIVDDEAELLKLLKDALYKAVSYTHLAVYKRQVSTDRPGAPARRRGGRQRL